MVKNWLIRTKNNHILGPVSKDKVKELLNKKSIKGDDEVCCGNGYWIFVREEDLLEKYLIGDEEQAFNPVQEAAPCEISSFPPDYSLLKETSINEIKHNQVNQTLITKNPLLDEVNVKAEASEDQVDESPAELENDVEFEEDVDSEKKKTKRVIKRRSLEAVEKQKSKQKSKFTLNIMLLVGLILLIIFFASNFLKNDLLKSLISNSLNQIIPSVYADDLEKKKTGI